MARAPYAVTWFSEIEGGYHKGKNERTCELEEDTVKERQGAYDPGWVVTGIEAVRYYVQIVSTDVTDSSHVDLVDFHGLLQPDTITPCSISPCDLVHSSSF